MALDFPASPNDGDEYEDFYWDAAAGIWRRKLTVTNLGDLTDTTITDPQANQSLVYNGTSWVNSEVATGFEQQFLLMG